MGCDDYITGIIAACRTDFNPRSPNGLRLKYQKLLALGTNISIHAARMGCDQCVYGGCCIYRISIHAARMGCDLPLVTYVSGAGISIHAARMGCDVNSLVTNIQGKQISIHAARMGCDNALCYLHL